MSGGLPGLKVVVLGEVARAGSGTVGNDALHDIRSRNFRRVAEDPIEAAASGAARRRWAGQRRRRTGHLDGE